MMIYLYSIRDCPVNEIAFDILKKYIYIFLRVFSILFRFDNCKFPITLNWFLMVYEQWSLWIESEYNHDELMIYLLLLWLVTIQWKGERLAREEKKQARNVYSLKLQARALQLLPKFSLLTILEGTMCPRHTLQINLWRLLNLLVQCLHMMQRYYIILRNGTFITCRI